MKNAVRSWDFTVNNYTARHLTWLETIKNDVSRLCVAKEEGENGTPHLQGRVTFKRTYRLKALKKLSGDQFHWEPTKCEQDCLYQKKMDGDVIFDVDNRKQGSRSDLLEVRQRIVEGTKVDDIVIENPVMFHQYGRTLQKIEDVAMRKRYRTEMTEGVWIFGYTGGGKSHEAFEGYSPETHYVYNKDGGWWDGYAQQPIVVINEFRGDIPYSFLLELVDKWPVSVRRRCREPIPFLSKKVIVTSSMPPHEVYHNLNERDSLAQLYRRFKLFFKKDAQAPLEAYEPPKSNPEVHDDQHYILSRA